MKDKQFLHVAVGVIKDEVGRVLISLRHKGAHQGGLWEFPGGKVEEGETIEDALKRELKEELNISVERMNPLIQIKHQYSDLNVFLDVWTISHFSGVARGIEGQQIKWVSPCQLIDFSFPAANASIITAAMLPNEYAILNTNTPSDLLKDLKRILELDIKLIQARIKGLSAFESAQFIKEATLLCQKQGAQLLINSAVLGYRQLDVDGVHLTSADLMKLEVKPPGYRWVAASCHHIEELKHAEKLGLDFVVIAPVLKTNTHPNVKPIGWEQFEKLAASINVPAFALGGMQKQNTKLAQSMGAQGIAGITCFL